MGAISFKFERALLAAGTNLVAGVDEAGRGPLAGPVVAAAVILPSDWFQRGLPRKLRGLNDSKKLLPQKREYYYHQLASQPEIRYGVGQMSVEEIDRFNILQASHRAMNAALAQLQIVPHHVLVDGLRVHTLHYPQTPVVDGDAKCFSIAAASILAKVTRDRLMDEYDRLYPAYGFAEHKGYATPRHLAALAQHGPCPLHRRSFYPLRPVELEFNFDEPLGSD